MRVESWRLRRENGASRVGSSEREVVGAASSLDPALSEKDGEREREREFEQRHQRPRTTSSAHTLAVRFVAVAVAVG